MKTIFKEAYILAALLGMMFANSMAQSNSQSFHPNTVNLILGDVSFQEKFGADPDLTTDENLRIHTHLTYVQDILSDAETSHLTPEQIQNRNQLLIHLQDYIDAGIFPRNYKYPGERRPNFIDERGQICAVGYLIEKSTGRELADLINSEYQYAAVREMKLPELADWQEKSGFTITELGMIQPNYDGDINVLDVVTVVNFVLGITTPTDAEMAEFDQNQDGQLNVLDILLLVGLILGN